MGGDPGAASGQRLGRPRAVDAHADRRRRRGQPRRLLRAQRPLRRPRARHGGDRQRADAARPAGLLVDLLQLLRLHEGRDAAECDPAPARDLRLHARLDRARRGRADAPADRAARPPARDAEPLHGAPGGRQRDAAGVAVRARADERAGGVRPEPPGDAGLGPGRRARRRRQPRRLRAARRLGRRRPGRDPDRHGLRGADLHRGGGPARGGRDLRARGVGALPGALRRAGLRLPRLGAAAERAGARLGRGRLDVRVGPLDDRRRRSGRDDRLRRLGAPAGAVRALRLHRRGGGRPRPSRGRAAGERGRERAPGRADRGRHERLARPDPAQPHHQRRARAAGPRGLAARRDLQPRHLREGDPRVERLRRADRRAGRRGRGRARHLRGDRDRRRAARLRRAARGLGRVRRRRRLRVARGGARVRARERVDARAGARLLAPRRPAQPDDQDPRHRRGRARRSRRPSRAAST